MRPAEFILHPGSDSLNPTNPFGHPTLFLAVAKNVGLSRPTKPDSQPQRFLIVTEDDATLSVPSIRRFLAVGEKGWLNGNCP